MENQNKIGRWLDPAALASTVEEILGRAASGMDAQERWQAWKRSGEGKRLQLVIFGMIMAAGGEPVNETWLMDQAQQAGINTSRCRDGILALTEVGFITRAKRYINPTHLGMERWGEREAAVGSR